MSTSAQGDCMENKEYFKVIEYIKEQMKNGTIQIGGKLETERKLSEKLGISRPSIREALRSMENIGLIESKQGSGNYLLGDFSKNLTESFSLMLLMKQVDYVDITEVRRAIELEAYKIAMRSISDQQLKDIKSCLVNPLNERFENEILFDRSFHFAIVKATGNGFMMNIVEPLASVCEELIEKTLKKATIDEREQLAQLHMQIYLGLEEKNLEKGLSAINAHYDLINQLQ
ncbi:FadR/GntR family transcriptional regulator [Cellulosilyticum sp. WCF-2]|uniref:FadR/GntR family transcriptional regulator n=1 Tax=Cellulosilyticum sp. WCF-2 TaxID=2497860 RepID=UPI000F8D7D0E|nr:GntR family transcriptional regulator [Cellulosilyticum sp. WCF-2]QEH69860.1 FadR family transcriptional regulator [Cellulosilyticum sp. WCF-2]